MATVAALTVGVRANTQQFDRGMRRTAASTRLLGRAAIGAGAAIKSLAAAFLPLAGAAAILGAAKSVEGFNRAMKRSLALLGPMSDEMREALGDTAREVAAATGFAAEDLAATYGRLAQEIGREPAALQAALPVVAEYARVTGTDLTAAVERLTQVQDTMGLSAGTAAEQAAALARIGDVLTKGALEAGVSIEDFANAMGSKAAIAAHDFGLSLEQTGALFLALGQRGFVGIKASRELERALRNTSRAGLTGAEAFERLAETVGSAEEVDRLRVALEGAGGTMRAVAAESLTPLERGWSRLKQTILEGAGTLFTPLLDGLGKAFGWIVDAIENLRATWRIRWELLKVDAQIVWDFIATAAIVSLRAIGFALGELARNWEGVWQDMKAFALAIGAAIVAGFQTAFDTIPRMVQTIGQSAVQVFQAVGRLIENFAAASGEAVASLITGEDPIQAFRDTLDVEGIARDISQIGGALDRGAGAITDTMAAIGESAGAAFSETWQRESTGTITGIAARISDFIARGMAEGLDAGLLAERDRLLAELAAIGQSAGETAAGVVAPAVAGAAAAAGEAAAGPALAAIRAAIPEAPGAVLRGSQEAFSILARREREGGERTAAEATAAATKATADLAAKQVAILGDIRTAILDSGDEGEDLD